MNRRYAFLIVAPLLTLVAGCAQGPSGVAESFMRALEAGDTAKALDYVDPELKQVGGMKLAAGLTNAANSIKALGGFKSLEVTSTATDGDHSNVSMKHIMGNGTAGTETDKLRRVEGKWYITM